MKDLPVRKTARLKNYDYSSAGCYFITICVKDRHEILWDPAPVGARIARPLLSETGIIVETAIKKIPLIYPGIDIDRYVVMPNHVHMILIIRENHGRAMRAPTISRVINQMKGYATKQIGYSIWQKLFHDRIIRDEDEYRRIWLYIDENPARWAEDEYFVK